MDKETTYTLVIHGPCPGIYKDQDVYLIDSEGRECFAGNVKAVQFSDALEELEQLEG